MPQCGQPTRERSTDLSCANDSDPHISAPESNVLCFRWNSSPLPSLRRRTARVADLFRRLLEPIFETCLAGLRAAVRNQRPLAHLDPVVTRMHVGDHFAWILARRQVPPDGFIEMKLFRPADFHGAVHR